MPKLVSPKRVTKLNIVGPDYNMGYLRMLVYGKSGSGKTHFIGTALSVEEICPILICDSDVGTMTISDKKVDVIPRATIDDLEDASRYVRENPDEYKTVVIDGLTATYNQIVRDRLSSPDRKAGDKYVPTQQDWMHATFKLRMLLSMFKSLPVNFIATAMTDVRQDEFTNAVITRPGLSNKLAQEVGAEFDIVGYASSKRQVNETIYTMQLEPFGGRAAKNRSIYSLPAVIEDPDMGTLYRRCILGEPFEGK